MNPRFAEFVESLEPCFQALVQMTPVTAVNLPITMPRRGIYLFSEAGQALYVGRSNHIRQRIGLHRRPGSAHNQATFAFRLTRVETGYTQAAYTTKGSRKALLEDPTFNAVFDRNKQRIRTMALRFVEETDGTRQALLEIYTATVLNTPYNDFDNH